MISKTRSTLQSQVVDLTLLLLAAVTLALLAGQWTRGVSSAGAAQTDPALAANAIHDQYITCMNQNGATYPPVPGTEYYRLTASDQAFANCAYLEMAANAAARVETAPLQAAFLKLGAQPAVLMRCLGQTGFAVAGIAGTRVDFQSPQFAAAVASCGVKIPAA